MGEGTIEVGFTLECMQATVGSRVLVVLDSHKNPFCVGLLNKAQVQQGWVLGFLPHLK